MSDGFYGWMCDALARIDARLEAAEEAAMLSDWQFLLLQRVADAYERGDEVLLTWARGAGKRAFRAELDREMEGRGWTVLAPGVYRPPGSDPTTKAG